MSSKKMVIADTRPSMSTVSSKTKKQIKPQPQQERKQTDEIIIDNTGVVQQEQVPQVPFTLKPKVIKTQNRMQRAKGSLYF